MKTKNYISRKFRKGSLLGLVMAIGLCLGLLGLGSLQLGYWSRSTAATSTFVINARMAADAGLQAALYQMNLDFPADPTLGTQSGTLDNSNASYTYDVSHPVTGHFQIDSQGTNGRQTRTVHAITDYSSMFDYALFVTNDIVMRNGSIVDGYDSTVGPYGGANSLLSVEIGSNTTDPRQGSGGDEGIFLISDVDLYGNVAVGPGLSPEEIWGEGNQQGVLDADPDSISGSVYSLLEPYSWENVQLLMPAEYQVISGDIRFGGEGVITTIGTPDVIEGREILYPDRVIQCNDFRIDTAGILEIYGNVVLTITGDLRLDNSAQILVTSGSTLTIFLDGDFFSPNDCLLINQNTIENPKPQYFEIFATSSEERDWTIGNSGTFYGVIYAPNVNLVMNNSGDIYGSIAAKSCDLKNSGDLHYDLVLAGQQKYFTGYIIQRWWEEAE